MLDIQVLNAFGAAAVPECEYIKSHVMISSEAELKDLLPRIKEYPVLVCVIPSAQGDDRDFDNMAEQNHALFYVLAPMQEKYTMDERMEVWAKTQQGMKDLKKFIVKASTDQSNEFFELFMDNDFGKRSIEPEYNFLQMVGWSLLFDFSTEGV